GAQRTFVMVADSIPSTVPAAAAAIATALGRSGWTVLADHAVGVEGARCGYAARVVVAVQPKHSSAVLSRGATGAFAAPVRVSVFEDERGVHAAVVNPLSLERTMVAETGLEAAGRALVAELSATVAAATHGRPASRPYGQSRDRGLIGKTMGVMAGGPFADQVETLLTEPAGTSDNVRGMADRIMQRLQKPAPGEWGLHAVYRLDLPEQHAVVIGVSGAAMEARAFSIVGAGNDDSRGEFKCPGLAYAAAFPLEVVVRRDGPLVRAEAIGAMFRMKMYFEDAGRMTFARNMMMPGSIAKELRGAVAGK
ncbi:MAG: hypothetical protein ACYC7F_06155, partial [Gemmatimonadaceae bacterium]